MDADTLRFFAGRAEELGLYAALLDWLTPLGEVTPVVHRTQISLRNRRVFACVSMLRVLPKALLPEHFIVLSLGLPYALQSPRVTAVQTGPNRWTHHIVLPTPQALDGELMDWVRAAYAFADRKHPRLTI